MESDEQLARRLQLEEEGSITRLPRNMINDEELARLLQSEEDAGQESSDLAVSESHAKHRLFGLHVCSGLTLKFF